VGTSPVGVAIDETTDTVYVANSGGTVSVVNGARCNATVTNGCARPLATIVTGGFDVAAAFDPLTHTVYVASVEGEVYVIDGADCNARTTAGCGQTVRSVADAGVPVSVAIDVATDTVYTADNGTGNGDTTSVINGATCNGRVGSGCHRTPVTVKVGNGAAAVEVDQATNTVYVSGGNDGTVSVIDGARCNGTVTAGCVAAAHTVYTGAGPYVLAVDPALHTLFTINASDDTISAIDTTTCNGSPASRCPGSARTQQATPSTGRGYVAFSNVVTLLPNSPTAYLVNEGGPSLLGVASIGSCNAVHASGCRKPVPNAPDPEWRAVTDSTTDTIYASNATSPAIDVLDVATCHAGQLSGCGRVAEIPMADPGAAVGAVDGATHTLYASDSSGTVSVIDTASCNATDTTGCGGAGAQIAIGTDPGAPVLEARTGTLYVPYGDRANRIAVVNTAACNATDTSGCAKSVVGSVPVPSGTYVIAVSDRTDTVYAPRFGKPFAIGSSVSVIDGASCNATDQVGCDHVTTRVKVGLFPYGVAVDDATHTVYVANNWDGDSPGTVSVINSLACNGTHARACARTMPTITIGRSPRMVAVDTTTDVVYVTDFSSAGVSIIHGATCNGEVRYGCAKAAAQWAVASQPNGIALSQQTNTVYVMDHLRTPSMSVFRGAAAGSPRRAALRVNIP
jgi:DNA-binding beta-propeller fold protein YncE